jgi:hypothetical protein
MIKTLLFLSPLLCVMLYAGDAVSAEFNKFSDNTRELFYIPRTSAVAGSDIVFDRNGSPLANPSLLCFDSTNELSLSYASFYQNTFSTSVLSYAGTINRLSGFSVSLSYLYNPGIAGTENLEIGPDSTPVYDPARLVYSTESVLFFHGGYGYKFLLSPRFEVGLGAGLNAQRHALPFGMYMGYGMGFDAGLMLNFPRPEMRLTLVCDNITSNYTRWSSTYSEYAYPHLRFGMGWQKEIPYIYGHIKLQYKTLDLLGNEGANTISESSLFGDEPTSGSGSTSQSVAAPTGQPDSATLWSDPVWFLLSGSIGLEYKVMNVFAVRVGHSAVNAWTFGCGINMFKNKVALDFAYLSHELAPTYQLSVTYRH